MKMKSRRMRQANYECDTQIRQEEESVVRDFFYGIVVDISYRKNRE